MLSLAAYLDYPFESHVTALLVISKAPGDNLVEFLNHYSKHLWLGGSEVIKCNCQSETLIDIFASSLVTGVYRSEGNENKALVRGVKY